MKAILIRKGNKVDLVKMSSEEVAKTILEGREKLIALKSKIRGVKK